MVASGHRAGRAARPARVTAGRPAAGLVASALVGQESPPDVDQLAGMLADRLDTAVSVELGYVPLILGEAPAP